MSDDALNPPSCENVHSLTRIELHFPKVDKKETFEIGKEPQISPAVVEGRSHISDCIFKSSISVCVSEHCCTKGFGYHHVHTDPK